MKYIIILGITLISIIFPIFKCYIVDDYRKIFTLQKNITELFKTAGGYNNGHELMTTLCKYIDEMEDLQIGLKNEDTESINILKEIYISGGPHHVHSPPLEKLAKTYKWDETDIEEFKSAINVTNYLWAEVSKEIEKSATDGMNFVQFKD